jgi:hypothetical protein
MTATAAFVERTPEPKQFSNDDLLTVFTQYRQKFGDVGLAVTAMHMEALERIASLEERLAKLEQKRK